MEKISVFCAGVAVAMAKLAESRLQEKRGESVCEIEIGGSSKGISNLINGKNYDVMILADCKDIEDRLIPDYAQEYQIWAGNEMAVIGKRCQKDNWLEVLTAPDSIIKHVNPYNDPGGYRAVMAMMLADHVQPGLSKKLLNHPNYHGLDRDQYQPGMKPPMQEPDEVCRLGYKSIAVARNLNYATLPDQMNQGNPDLEALYHTVSFTVDGGYTAYGCPIEHGILVPDKCMNPEGGQAFLQEFTSINPEKFGFNKHNM